MAADDTPLLCLRRDAHLFSRRPDLAARLADSRPVLPLSPDQALPHEAWGDHMFALQLLHQQRLDLERLTTRLAERRAERDRFHRFFEIAPDLLCTTDLALTPVTLDDTSDAAYATMNAALARYYDSPAYAGALAWLAKQFPAG